MWNIRKICRLYLVTDDVGRDPESLARIVRLAIGGGVTAVQYREKTASPSRAREAIRLLAGICSANHVPLLVNSDIRSRLDDESFPDGIHFNSRTLPPHPGAMESLAGYSAHDAEDAQAAFHHNVHFCTISPVFATPSKIGILDPIRLEGVTAARQACGSRCLVALGGIDESRASACIRAGADGIAVMRAIMNANDPKHAALKLREQIDDALMEREESESF